MSDDGDDLNFFDILGQMSGVECPQCGETTSRYDVTCESCGASLGNEGEDPTLNVRDGAESRYVGLRKVEMQESKNLIRLREAYQGVASGTLSNDEYSAIVEEVLELIESALELYASPYMQERVAKMEPGPANVYKQMSAAAKEMYAGLTQMLKYLDSGNLGDAEAGLKKVESGLWKVDAAQDVAIDKATELAEAGEA